MTAPFRFIDGVLVASFLCLHRYLPRRTFVRLTTVRTCSAPLIASTVLCFFVSETSPVVALAQNGTEHSCIQSVLDPEAALSTIGTQPQTDEHSDALSTSEHLRDLAQGHYTQGQLDQAEQRYLDALCILDQLADAFPDVHPMLIRTLNDIGTVHHARGDLTSARRLYDRALELQLRLEAGTDQDLAMVKANLGSLLHTMGDLTEAVDCYEDVLSIETRIHGDSSPAVIATLNALTMLYCDLGNHEKARSLVDRAVLIGKGAHGNRSLSLAQSYSAIAAIHTMEKNYGEAHRFLVQALDIYRTRRGEKHPDTARIMGRIGDVLLAQGRFADARDAAAASLRTLQTAFGDHHPDSLRSSDVLAIALYRLGDLSTALRQASKGIRECRRCLEAVSAAQSERQQVLMTAAAHRLLGTYLSVADAIYVPSDEAYAEILFWKGLVLARQERNRRRLNVANTGTRRELAITCALIADLISNQPSESYVEPDGKFLKLLQRKEALERQLTIGDGRSEVETDLECTLPRLVARLPRDAVFVDFIQYSDLGLGSYSEAGAPSLVAFVVRPDGTVIRINLGRLEPIAAEIARWRAENVEVGEGAGPFRGGAKGPTPVSPDMETVCERVYNVLWRKIEPHVRGAKVIFVSPDGPIVAFPFAALPGSNRQRFLIEEASVVTCLAPQLLPEMKSEARQSQMVQENGNESVKGGGIGVCADYRDGGLRVRGKSSLVFGFRDSDDGRRQEEPRGNGDWARLVGTSAEVESIRELWQRSGHASDTMTLAKSPLEKRWFKEHAGSFRYLHLATHGFFSPTTERPSVHDTDGEAGSATVSAAPSSAMTWHQRLLSGLVLAGGRNGCEDVSDGGILTAIEIAEMDLSGTDLAVLSACNTGAGEVATGDGVLGLQRAFQMAGARSVVGSLWEVDDESTRMLMSEFYRNLWVRKLPKYEALRRAQVYLLRCAPGQSDKPRFWAPWILVGDPGEIIASPEQYSTPRLTDLFKDRRESVEELVCPEPTTAFILGLGVAGVLAYRVLSRRKGLLSRICG